MCTWLGTKVSIVLDPLEAARDSYVLAVAHPNVPELFIRVQTDGSMSPRDVFTSVCVQLINQLESLHQEFTREWELRRITNTGEQGNMQNGL